VFIYIQIISYYFTVSPTSLSIENITPENRLLGTEGQDLTVSCRAVGGIPAPNVVLIIDGQTVANKTQSVQHTLNAINRSYDHKTVTCQASHANYSQNPMTDSAVIYLSCK
jgi:catabolite regulation protein CreA